MPSPAPNDPQEPDPHEQLVRCHDRTTGLVAFVAIHSTALGPALGGTRFVAYPDEQAAQADALRLARAMSYKNALAGLDHGGGKAVIMGDPGTLRSPALLHAYGRFVESLGGRYVTAADAGTSVADMDEISTTCRWVTGRSPHLGGCGDSSVLTASGLHTGMKAAAEVRWGSPSLTGRRVGVAGVGKVGSHLVGHLLADGASVVATDISADAVAALRARHPEVEVVDSAADLVRRDLDIYSPCALGGALDDEVAGVLTAALVCGAANNQLATPQVAERLAERGILYAPDFVVNAGGVIQVADELHGFSMERAAARTALIGGTVRAVLERARADGSLPVTAAEHLARARMEEGRWYRTLYPGLASPEGGVPGTAREV
jgi:valine dehydrogenase (NAD+)